MNSFGTRVAGTVTVGVGLAFFAGRYDLFQNLAIFFVSVIVAIGVAAVIWIKWALG